MVVLKHASMLPISVALLSLTARSYAALTNDLAFDYVILGGGTAGSVLAYRLSADPSVSVALIEAGESALENPLVETIYGDCIACASPVDWNYTTVAQKYLNGSVQPYHAGKCLGGTSSINGMSYLRPALAEFDTWTAVGNKDWSWNSLLPYFKKSEHLQIPPTTQQAEGATYVAGVHGFDGPLDIGWPENLDPGSFGSALNETWQSLGLKWNVDPNTGLPQGLYLKPSEYNLQLGGVREDANRAYLLPISNRSNLKIMTKTTALKLVLDNDASSGSMVATGVDVITSSGENQTIGAAREVILSLGTLRDPGLLEASGIGNPNVLGNLSIPVKIDLPGVGAHVQDQITFSLAYNTTGDSNSTDTLTNIPTYAFVTAEDIFGANTSAVAADARSNISKYAKILAAASNGASSVAAEEQILSARIDLIFNQSVPIGELILQPTFGASWQTLPLSTGDVHASTAGPSNPLINPNWLQIDFDFQVQVALAKFVRKLYSTPPLSEYSPTEIAPGLSVVPEDATDAEWRAYFDTAGIPAWHGTGSAAMMKRELGGVVDDQMIVYGTSNLRVVDASAIPFQLNGHPTSTIYAMAEKAADMIKARWAGV